MTKKTKEKAYTPCIFSASRFFYKETLFVLPFANRIHLDADATLPKTAAFAYGTCALEENS